jgi:hypothetical protein
MPDGPLERLLDAYGGLALWRNLKHVTLCQDSLGGPLPAVKGLGRTFPAPRVIRVDPVRRIAEFYDYPQPGHRAIFAAGSVQIIDANGSAVLERSRYRECFRGLRKYRRWSPADAAYFFGYALTTYLGTPFILCDYATDVREWKGGVRVSAEFPAIFDTHSRRQTFWFDRDGLLVRHDYRADVVGWWATGSHITADYEIVSGLPVARRRDVYVRCLHAVTPIPVLSARLRPIEVKIG